MLEIFGYVIKICSQKYLQIFDNYQILKQLN